MIQPIKPKSEVVLRSMPERLKRVSITVCEVGWVESLKSPKKVATFAASCESVVDVATAAWVLATRVSGFSALSDNSRKAEYAEHLSISDLGPIKRLPPRSKRAIVSSSAEDHVFDVASSLI